EDQKKILKDIGIDFQVWDKDELSRLLKDYPKLVYDFFGDIILDAFLGKELTQIFYQKFSEYAVLTITEKIKFTKPENYIARYLTKLEHYEESKYTFDSSSHKKLDEILKENNKIVVLSEAGNGKSVELMNIASKMSNDYSQLYPFLYSLSSYTNENIIELIPEQYTSLPVKNILFLFDGLDEIHSNNKLSFKRKLETFISLYPDANIIISSRHNYYVTNSEDESIKRFSEFVLTKLTWDEISNFIKENIGSNTAINSFEDSVIRNKIDYLTANPFYLSNLVRIFNNEGSLPFRKSEIFNKIIDISFTSDIIHYRNSLDLSGNKLLVQNQLLKIALVMELTGKGYIDEEEIQKIIPDIMVRDLIKSTGLFLQSAENRYQFLHNNFREFMCSKKLSELD